MDAFMKKLNWGCGSIQPKDWINVDHDWHFYNGTDKNFYNNTMAFTDNEFDIIVAHASLQQVEWHSLVDQLKELKRILKPGGVLRISLPDIISGFEAYRVGNITWFPNNEEKLSDRFSAWLTWYSTSKTLLTRYALENKIMESGFSDKKACLPTQTHSNYPEVTELDTRHDEFFFVEAYK